MNTNKGFTLIELLIALSFSLIIIVALFNSFFFISFVSRTADEKIDNDMRIAILSHQFEKDLAGVFIPYQALEEPKKASSNTPEPSAKLLKKVFYATNNQENTNLLLITFISNNPLTIYQKNKETSAKPLMVRIIYRLEKDNEYANSFVLTRQEGSMLDFDAYAQKTGQPSITYKLINRIKSLQLTYSVPEKDKKDTEKEPNYKHSKEWLNKEDKAPLIPSFVTMKIVLWDEDLKKEQEHTLSYLIPTFQANKDLVFNQKKEQKGKPGMPDKQETQPVAPTTPLASNTVLQPPTITRPSAPTGNR